MATKTWYINQINVGGTNPNRLWWDGDPQAGLITQATSVTGWTVAKTAAARYAILNNGTEAASGTFTTTISPDNTAPVVNNSYPSTAIYTPPDLLSTTDSITTLYEYNGYFPAGNWVFSFPMIAVTTGGTQDGRIGLRVFKAPRSGTAFGTTTELTGARQVGTTVTNLATATTQTSTVTWAAPAFFLNNEFLIVKIAWEITGQAGSNTSDVLFRYGSGCTMVSPTFRSREYNIN